MRKKILFFRTAPVLVLFVLAVSMIWAYFLGQDMDNTDLNATMLLALRIFVPPLLVSTPLYFWGRCLRRKAQYDRPLYTPVCFLGLFTALGWGIVAVLQLFVWAF